MYMRKRGFCCLKCLGFFCLFVYAWLLTYIQNADQSAFPEYSSLFSVSFLDLMSVKEPSEANMDRLCPVSEETSSQGSTDIPREINETTTTELTVPDEKITQIENILDLWSGSLKVFILYKFLKNKIQMSVCCHRMRRESCSVIALQNAGFLCDFSSFVFAYYM